MNRWNLITTIDGEVLKVLYKNLHGLTAYEISGCIGKSAKQTYNSLIRLHRLNFVIKLGNSPAIWKLKLNAHNPTPQFIKVACPKCKEERYVVAEQLTATCRNKECKTKNQRRTRFQITKFRIVT